MMRANRQEERAGLFKIEYRWQKFIPLPSVFCEWLAVPALLPVLFFVSVRQLGRYGSQRPKQAVLLRVWASGEK